MGKFMHPKTALARVVEDDKVPIMVRYRALEQIANPSLNMLRRLLVKTANGKPVPSRIRALAALKYDAAIKAQNARRERRLLEKKSSPVGPIDMPGPKTPRNPLGI